MPRDRGPLPGHDPSSDGTVVRKHAPRMPGSVAGVASERDCDPARGDAHPRPTAAAARRATRTGQAAADLRRARSIVISRENLHDESRLRMRCRPSSVDTRVSSTARGGQRHRRGHQLEL
jgi:hypothetical protein